MNIQDVITLLGALATFLFGMSTMTSGLEKLTSGKLASMLERLTDNILKGVLLGAVVAGMVHSSAATTVMCIGFVNAGILKLRQAVGVIMGANIGTTITAQILRLGGLSDENLLLSLLKPEMLGPILAFLGILFFSFFNKGTKKTVGQILIGLGLLFIGIKSMENALAPLTELEAFQQLFLRFSNPVLGIAVGAAITALIQSSTASVAILQALSASGVVTFATAMPIIMGQNIGTCVTAILSSIGATKNAKRTAAVHLYFNVIGTLVFLVVLYGVNSIYPLPFWDATMDYGSIANLHSLFNIVCTLLLLPFNRQLVRLVELTIPDSGSDSVTTVLDPRFLSTPSVALERARTMAIKMGELARDNYRLAVGLLSHYDERQLEKLNEQENMIDHMEGALDQYLVQLSRHSLDEKDSDLVSDLLHALSDFERIGDYAVNLSESATIVQEKGLTFSPVAEKELETVCSAIGEALDLTMTAYRFHDVHAAFQVEPLEEVVDLLTASLRDRHVERLKTGACTVEVGTQFLELLINLERISDHCSNAAVRILHQYAQRDTLVREDIHSYLHSLHQGNSSEFNTLFQLDREKYALPASNSL
ncbi:Na/Pi cotransporter family protein [Pseudoflavonifractor sp. AF19-9AC]|uniref:Na/Pi cotransporter family protein n=1 Tax=Pseudoflavonifractor sp. AF19-9AC TaxID=2292244 RepID=UPI000E4EB03D|nr:Na/Pi cotransporter family protein [Pseudoflavonifractor sp. AF19-9AC]RHR10161.1 Na/Pi cotransporter family protein [Pseudoflavonifractor sp. AF19-9AC]